jgi:hypothetical protein
MENIRKMKRKILSAVVLIAVVFSYSCNNETNTIKSQLVSQNQVLQQEDGSISLKVDKADCYSDVTNPSTNTAEWDVLITKSGRFNVWLSSATKDTTNLEYKNPVLLSIHDNRLELHPECDKIVQNSSDVKYPYFRADSFMGSLYIQDTGHYNIQIISDKIIPSDFKNEKSSLEENSKILSVLLTPEKL